MEKKRKVYELTIMEEDEISGINSISIVDDPAIEQSLLFFSKDKSTKLVLEDFEVMNEEKRIIVSPAMLPGKLIPRMGADGELYDVFFSAETIRMIAEKYMRNGYNTANDVSHDSNRKETIYVVESWIKQSEFDKSMQYEQYRDNPIGTWYVSMRIMDDQTWEAIKNHTLTGVSISGFFSQEEVQMSKEEMFLEDFEQMLIKLKK